MNANTKVYVIMRMHIIATFLKIEWKYSILHSGCVKMLIFQYENFRSYQLSLCADFRDSPSIYVFKYLYYIFKSFM